MALLEARGSRGGAGGRPKQPRWHLREVLEGVLSRGCVQEALQPVGGGLLVAGWLELLLGPGQHTWRAGGQ